MFVRMQLCANGCGGMTVTMLHNIHYASFDGVTERSEVIAIALPFSALAARVWTQKPAVT